MDETCPRLLNLVVVPGKIDSPDGPSGHVSLRCAKKPEHKGAHWFPGLQMTATLATEYGATIMVMPRLGLVR